MARQERLVMDDPPAYQKTDFATSSFVSIVFIMSATDVIRELKELPSREREKVLRWLQQQGLKDLWARADALMKDAPKLNEDEILRLPRVRPSGF
jgi:Mg/Co/Ni transporter MgtE